MEERGRQHEARGVDHAGGVLRHLGAVGMAVEDREQGDQSRGDGERDIGPKRHDSAEHDHRGGDAQLNERHWHAGNAECAAGRHDQDEARWHEPERAAAELPGEDTDGDHRQNVVEPAERMREAVHETVPVADPGMSEGGGRNEREGGGDRQASAHGWSP
jgi:hypothetical protein